MRYPWANTVLLVLLLAQLATGLGALFSGSESFRWVLWLHGIVGYALAVVLLPKGSIIWGVFSRRKWTLTRVAFAGMAGLLLAILGTGFYWSTIGPAYMGGFSLMVVHGTLAAALVAPLLWHFLARRWVLRVAASRDRRALLRLAGIGVAGLALWRVAAPTKVALALRGAARRFTGSYERGSLTGQFPEVSWLWDAPRPLDGEAWRLVVEGLVEQPLSLTINDLAALPQETVTETLDCTGGWFSEQEWRGVRVGELLQAAGVRPEARSITVQSVTGYSRRFSVEEVSEWVLATQVAGQPLSHGHGAPLRLIAAGHRGYEWVKWVVRLHANDSGPEWQPPLPLQ